MSPIQTKNKQDQKTREKSSLKQAAAAKNNEKRPGCGCCSVNKQQ
jgi:hypothetical protein